MRRRADTAESTPPDIPTATRSLPFCPNVLFREVGINKGKGLKYSYNYTFHYIRKPRGQKLTKVCVGA